GREPGRNEEMGVDDVWLDFARARTGHARELEVPTLAAAPAVEHGAVELVPPAAQGALDLGDEDAEVRVARAGVHLRDEQDPHGGSVGWVIWATYEIEPAGAAEELARIESTGLR